MSEMCEIREVDGIDEVRFIPQGVCSKLMNLKIKDNKILYMETVGGCSGNLKGIGSLVVGMDIAEVEALVNDRVVTVAHQAGDAAEIVDGAAALLVA